MIVKSRTVSVGKVVFEGIEVIAFDKDGTLLDLDACWLEPSRAWVREASGHNDALTRELAVELGLHPDRLAPDGPLASGTLEQITALTEAALVRRGVDKPEAEARTLRARRLATQMAAAAELVPLGDVAGSLQRLARAGLALVVITADERQSSLRALDALGLRDLLALWLTAEDALPPKPHPALIPAVAEWLGTVPEAVLMVGDSAADSQTAEAGGAAGFVLVAPRGRRPEVEAAAVVSSVDELEVR
ncbi:HAD family hydrolase [soil metagenome]